jgi:hypothetical protein
MPMSMGATSGAVTIAISAMTTIAISGAMTIAISGTMTIAIPAMTTVATSGANSIGHKHSKKGSGAPLPFSFRANAESFAFPPDNPLRARFGAAWDYSGLLVIS